ncbi:MAG: DUF1801 domain-containing protein, partial [Pseudomonadota bacterium]
YLASVEPAGRRADAEILTERLTQISGWQPRVWSDGMVGFGRYHYDNSAGTGFAWPVSAIAPRKSGMVLHVMPHLSFYPDELARLGPLRRGAGCLYLPRLAKLDRLALEALIRASLLRMRESFPCDDGG